MNSGGLWVPFSYIRSSDSDGSATADEILDLLVPLFEELHERLNLALLFFDADHKYFGRTGAIGALGAVCDFIDAFDDFRDERLSRPLTALLLALGDATRGVKDPMLKPEKLKHRSPSDSDTLRLRAHASVAMELYMRSGMKSETAAKEVAHKLRMAGYVLPGRADQEITSVTIKNWRDKVKGGLPGQDEDTDCYLFLIAGIQADEVGAKKVADRIIDMTSPYVRPKNPQTPPS